MKRLWQTIKTIQAESWIWPDRMCVVAYFAGCAAFLLVLLFDSDGFIVILDHANLAFHEAGHVFFGLFGDTLHLYGGTLGQFVFPLIVMGTFWTRRQTVGFTVGWIWLGENLRYVATYAGDASARMLPLAGNGPRTHDWWTILRRWDALAHDKTVALVFNTLAWCIMTTAVMWMAWGLWQNKRQEDS